MDSAAAQLYPNPTTELAMAGTYAVPVLHHLPGLSFGRRRAIFIGVSFKLFNSNSRSLFSWPNQRACDYRSPGNER